MSAAHRHTDLTPAQHAVKAARNRHVWGRNTARLYCDHHQVPLGLYRLACQLQAAQAVIDLMPAHLKRQALGDYQTIEGISCSKH